MESSQEPQAPDHILINAQGSAYSANHVFIYQQQKQLEERLNVAKTRSKYEIQLIKNGMNIDHTWPKLAPNMTFLSGFALGHARVSRGWWGVPGAKIFPKHDAYQTRRGIQHNHQMGQQESSFRSVTAETLTYILKNCIKTKLPCVGFLLFRKSKKFRKNINP